MNKLIIKYLLEIQEGCGGSCSDRPNVSSGCGLSPIRRGGTGVCTDYQDVEDLSYQGDYQTSVNPSCMPDTIYQRECEEENPAETNSDEDISNGGLKTPMVSTELPEGGEAGEKKKIIESYLDKLNEVDIDDIPDPPKEKKEQPVETPMEPTTMPQGGEAAGDMNQIPTDDTMGMGMGAEGMPGQEEVPQDPEYIGRIYELKKIYSRLVSIESFLNDASDPRLLKLRHYVSSSIELFQTLINNISAYKDNIDNLIVFYYKFLLIVYTLLRKFYEQENDEEKQEMERGK